MRRKLTPLEEHLAWIESHGGPLKAIEAETQPRVTFDGAPIKTWYDAHVAKLAARRQPRRG